MAVPIEDIPAEMRWQEVMNWSPQKVPIQRLRGIIVSSGAFLILALTKISCID